MTDQIPKPEPQPGEGEETTAFVEQKSGAASAAVGEKAGTGEKQGPLEEKDRKVSFWARIAPIAPIGANIATIVAAIVAVVALMFGTCQFLQTSDLQKEAALASREATAVGLYLDYLEHMRELDGDARDVSVVLSIAEHIYVWQQEDEYWKATVTRMLEDNRSLLLKHKVDCSTLSPKFKELVEGAVEEACR